MRVYARKYMYTSQDFFKKIKIAVLSQLTLDRGNCLEYPRMIPQLY